jgi:hypothetical protein
MPRRLFRITGHLVLLGFILLRATVGTSVAEQRFDGEDLEFSYSRNTDRVVFGGQGYAVHAHSNMEHPDASILYMQDLKTGARKKVFEAPNGTLGNPVFSPSGQFVAVPMNLREGGALVNPKLLVLTMEGQELVSFAKSRDFAWSPDSRFLAYTDGDWVGIDTFHSTGTWLYDLTSRTVSKIANQGDYAAWSPTGDSLLIWSLSNGLHVLRYDLRTEKITETNYRGIFLSPTGRYYHTQIPRFNEGGVEVYDTQSNQPILRQRPRLESVLPSARIVGWAPEGDVLILEVTRQDFVSEAYPQGQFDTVLYDVAHNIARLIEDDSVIGWQNGSAILHAKGKFTKRPLGTIPILPEQAVQRPKLPSFDHLKPSPPPPQ